MTPQVFEPSDTVYYVCKHCGCFLTSHVVTTKGYECPQSIAASGTTNKITLSYDHVSIARTPVTERTCKKCKNKSLRQVRLPGDDEDKAFCKYCGTTEEI